MALTETLGEDLDRRFEERGFGKLKIRLGLNGILNPMPNILPNHQDNTDPDNYNNPGYGLQMPALDKGYIAHIPFTTLDRAAVLEGITVAQAVKKGALYAVMRPGGYWKDYVVTVDADSDNVIWILMIGLKIR